MVSCAKYNIWPLVMRPLVIVVLFFCLLIVIHNDGGASGTDQNAGGEVAQDLANQLREKMGRAIVDNEKRVDANGNIRVYELPDNDGGGSYEVAGINDRYHPEMAARLRGLIEDGLYEQAEAEAAEYIMNYTDSAAQLVDDPGAELFVRDTMFNRGPTGGAKILQAAVGVKDDGVLGPTTKTAVGNAQRNPEQLIHKLRAARASYEREVVGTRPNLQKGLENRWKNVQQQALELNRSLRQALVEWVQM